MSGVKIMGIVIMNIATIIFTIKNFKYVFCDKLELGSFGKKLFMFCYIFGFAAYILHFLEYTVNIAYATSMLLIAMGQQFIVYTGVQRSIQK